MASRKRARLDDGVGNSNSNSNSHRNSRSSGVNHSSKPRCPVCSQACNSFNGLARHLTPSTIGGCGDTSAAVACRFAPCNVLLPSSRVAEHEEYFHANELQIEGTAEGEQAAAPTASPPDSFSVSGVPADELGHADWSHQDAADFHHQDLDTADERAPELDHDQSPLAERSVVDQAMRAHEQQDTHAHVEPANDQHSSSDDASDGESSDYMDTDSDTSSESNADADNELAAALREFEDTAERDEQGSVIFSQADPESQQTWNGSQRSDTLMQVCTRCDTSTIQWIKQPMLLLEALPCAGSAAAYAGLDSLRLHALLKLTERVSSVSTHQQ